MKYPRTVEGFTIKHAGGKLGKYGTINKYGTVKGDKGYGIFASRDYAAGEELGRVRGVRIKDTDARLTHRAIQIGPKLFIEPRRFSLFWYLNHSCSPNAYVDMDRLLARRAINAGEEIVADYSLFTDYASWDMECGCRTRNCRGTILPYSKLEVKPKRFISSYLT